MAAEKVAVEDLLRQADNVLFWMERLAILAAFLVPEYTRWLIVCFVLTNLNTSIGAHLFKREYPFLIERVAAIFLALSYRAAYCRHIAFVLFGLSSGIYVLNFMEKEFNLRIRSRTGGSETRESEGEDDPLRKDSELNRHAPEKDNDAGDEEASETGTRKNFMSLFEQLILDVLDDLQCGEIMFFLERLPIFVLICFNSRFPWSFTVFFGFSSLLHMLGLGSSPIKPEYVLRIERTALSLLGLYFLGGSHSTCWFLAVGLFALSNTILTINILAPEQAGRMVEKIIGLCCRTHSLCSREISNNEELLAEQVKMEGAPPRSIFEEENVEVDEDGTDRSKMEKDQEVKGLLIEATSMFALEISPIILFSFTRSFTACHSIFFWINILCGHHFPREPYIFFTDRVAAILSSAFYRSGSLFHGHLAADLCILSDVIFVVTEIRKGMGKGVQKNVGLCSRTCSLNPKESNEGEDEPLLEDREASEEKGNGRCEEQSNDNGNGSNEINNDLNTATRENEKDEEFEQINWDLCVSDSGMEGNYELQTSVAFNVATEIDAEELWVLMNERAQVPSLEELFELEAEPFAVAAELSKEVLGHQAKDNEKLEDDQKDSSAARTHAHEEDSPKWEEEKKDFMAKLTAATEASEHIRRCYEEQTHKWEEEKNNLIDEHNAAISSLLSLLNWYVENYSELEKEKSDLVVKLNAADACHEHDQGVISNYEQHFLNLEEENEMIADELDEATKSLEIFRDIQEQFDGCHRKLEEEKAELNSKLTATTFYQKLLEVPFDQRKEDEERNTNASKLSDAAESSESYRARLRDPEEVCHMLKRENLEIAARLNEATSSTESFHRRVRGLEEKCCTLETQMNNLTIALSAANGNAELYRGLLHNADCQ